ncbi:MAG: choice-of-anchor H family protein [Gammaproteobacteria bacterium]
MINYSMVVVMRTIVFLALFFCGSQSWAETPISDVPVRISKSVEVDQNTSVELKKTILQASANLTLPALVKQGARESTSITSSARHLYQLYNLYQVDTFLLEDFDGDGYYNQFSVQFDADINEGSADVYAIISLSLDGGPWNYFHTTDVFTLFGASSDDSIEIISTLEQGYPPGHYDILIEIYAVDSNEIVLVGGPYESTSLSLIPLEDQFNDEHHDHYVDPYISVGFGVTATGSMEMISIILLGLVAIRRRFLLAKNASKRI